MTRNLRYVLTFAAIGVIREPILHMDVLEIYEDTLLHNMTKILQTKYFIIEELHILSNLSCETDVAPNTTLEMMVYLNIFILGSVPRLQTEQRLISFMTSALLIEAQEDIYFQHKFSRRAAYVSGIFHQKNSDSNCHYNDFEKYSKFNDDYNAKYPHVHVTPLLICKQVIFNKFEYRKDLDGMNIELKYQNRKLHFDEYELLNNGQVGVCIDTVKDLFSEQEIFESIVASPLEVLTAVCLILSIGSLILTLLTYILLQPLRTLPGKNNICMMISLLLAQTLMLIQPHVVQIEILCGAIGFVSHFSWLSYFFWLGICTIHMCRVFSFGIVRNDSSPNKRFVKYCLIAFGIPALTVTACVSVSLAISGGQSYGYSSSRCFIDNKNIFITTLITPLIIVCLCNITLFIITAWKIKSNPKVQKSKSDSVNFVVYVKLFSLTGITWTIQIIDSFLLLSVLSYISTVLNGTQGLYIFLCYVCNKRTIHLYKRYFGCVGKDGSTAMSRTNTQTSRI